MLYDEYTTPLTMRQLAQFLFDKQLSPFKDDSGYDYDLQGYWLNKGNLNPTDERGHIGDEYKKPWHPTFSRYSKYYNGQPWALDWTTPLMRVIDERKLL